MIRSFLVSILISLASPWVAAQDEEADGSSEQAQTQPQGPRYPCKENEQHRAFDFWVGDWEVFVQDQKAGANEIKLILGDCVLFENWEGARGSTGKSFNFYDAAEDHWRQIWVDDRGGVIEFTGEVREGTMYYTATTMAQDGNTVEHKLTFSQNGDGSVRQLWEQSNDGGENWQTVWDGRYERK